MTQNRYESIWLSMYETPHRLGYVKARGLNTRYLECGPRDAPAIVMLHGTAGSLENFCRNYSTLSRHHRVIGIDMLGCGATEKPDFDCTTAEYVEHVRETLAALEIKEAYFIGLSMGSWIAASLERAHPGLVKKLIMVAPVGIVTDEEQFQKTVANARARRLNASGTPTWDSIKSLLAALVKHPDRLIDDLVAVRLDIYSKPAMMKAMPKLLAFMEDRPLTAEQWRHMTIPILVIANVDVPNMYLDGARAIARSAPNVTSVDFKDVDHWGQYERSDEFNRLALDYFAGMPLPAAL